MSSLQLDGCKNQLILSIQAAHMHVKTLTCAIIRLKAPSVVPRVVVAIPVVLICAGRLSIVSWVESSRRNMRMEMFTLPKHFEMLIFEILKEIGFIQNITQITRRFSQQRDASATPAIPNLSYHDAVRALLTKKKRKGGGGNGTEMTDTNSTIHAQTSIFAVVCVSETYPMPWAENLPPRRPEPPVNTHTCLALHH